MPLSKEQLIEHIRQPHYSADGMRSIASAQAVSVLRRWRIDELESSHARLHEKAGTPVHV